MVEEVKTPEVKMDPEFSLEALFLKGRVYKEYSLTPSFKVKFRSLITDESLEVRNDPEIESGNRMHTVTMIGVSAAAMGLEDLNGKKFEGTLRERKDKLKKMAAPIIEKILEKHNTFYNEVQELFPADPEELNKVVQKN